MKACPGPFPGRGCLAEIPDEKTRCQFCQRTRGTKPQRARHRADDDDWSWSKILAECDGDEVRALRRLGEMEGHGSYTDAGS